MKKFDSIGKFLCEYVSRLFAYQTERKDGSSKVFIKAFVYSSLVEQLDKEEFMFSSTDIPEAYDILKKEKNLKRGKEIYPSFVMAWIGYIMKYFAYTRGISEKRVYECVKPDELYAMYEAYHSLDNEAVVTRIIEAKNINLSLDNLNLLRKIYRGHEN